jgi:hypothetical protein
MERDRERERRSVGLCSNCRFAKRIESGKGSRFFLCRRSESDPGYPRYPRLPILSCVGYEAVEDAS